MAFLAGETEMNRSLQECSSAHSELNNIFHEIVFFTPNRGESLLLLLRLFQYKDIYDHYILELLF